MPEGALEVLSQLEVNRLRSTDKGGQHELLRRCGEHALAHGIYSIFGHDIAQHAETVVSNIFKVVL